MVKDAAGNDVTDQFEVSTTNGTLEITAREVTVKVEDKTVEYNGSEQYGNDAYTFNNVVAGQTATISYTPSKGTLADTYDNGSYANDFKVVDADGNEVTSNYTLGTQTKGKLTITDRTEKYAIQITMAGTMLHAAISTLRLKMTSSHFASVFFVRLSTIGTSILRHSSPAKTASNMAITTSTIWPTYATTSPSKPQASST